MLTRFYTLAFLIFLPTFALAQSKPNLIIILCDDLGYGDLGCFGNQTIHTPNIDRLAKEGIRFTGFYCAGAQCTPSRAGMLTGRYPIRFGLTYALMTHAGAGIPANETTLSQLLKKAGYATLLAGKWHLGDRPKYHPLKHGFDHFTGLLRGHDTEPRQLYRDEQIIDREAPLDSLTARYTAAAVDFIADQARRKQPFFLMLSHTCPHTPLAGTYAQAVEEIDRSTAQILAALKAGRIDDNTLIFFSSDNGPSVDKGEQGGSAGPLRAGKFSTFEGGLRVPAIFWFPARIKPRVENQPAILLDIFPTFLHLAGTKTPVSPIIDGRDISPVLLNTGKRDGDDFYFYLGKSLQACREGDWKLKLGETPAERPMLFNLRDDRGETSDLAGKHPDIAARLRDRMDGFARSIGNGD